MTDYSFAPSNMQLYQELRKRFPNVTHAMLMEAVEKHGNNLQRCIEDLSLSSPGHSTVSSHLHNLNMQRNPYPPGTDNRQPGVPAGTRSHSVSGVPGISRDERFAYGTGFPNMNHPRVQQPQSAPVVSGHTSPFSGVRFSFSNNGSSENMNVTSREHTHFKPAFTSPTTPTITTSIPKAPKPPVPPPTYLSHVEHHHMNSLAYNKYPSNSTREQYPMLYPPLSNDGYNERVASSPSQPRKHMTSLNMIPSCPQMMGNFRPDAWGAPPYGWNPNVGTHSTSVNLQLGPPSSRHPEVQITTSGNMNYGPGMAMPMGSASSRQGTTAPAPTTQASSPCLSRLHISISPNGGSISAMRSQINPHSTIPSARFQLQIPAEGKSLVNQTINASPAGRPYMPQASPRTSPKLLEEGFLGPHSIFDEDDPEQRKVKHSPLKPVPSPRMGDVVTSWNDGPGWPAAHPPPPNDGSVHQNELCSGEAYSQALLAHQKQKFDTLQRELERDKAQLESYRRDVASKELLSFRQQIRQDQMFFSFEDLQNLRAEIRSLMVDCQCMTRLVDHLHKGQVPLGETNEEFYKTINTGQQGPVLQITIPPSIPPSRTCDRSRPSQPLPQQLAPSHPSVIQARSSPKPRQQEDDDEGQTWECCACTFHNNPAMVMCEMCEMPKFVQASSMSSQSGAFPSTN